MPPRRCLQNQRKKNQSKRSLKKWRSSRGRAVVAAAQKRRLPQLRKPIEHAGGQVLEESEAHSRKRKRRKKRKRRFYRQRKMLQKCSMKSRYRKKRSKAKMKQARRRKQKRPCKFTMRKRALRRKTQETLKKRRMLRGRKSLQKRIRRRKQDAVADAAVDLSRHRHAHLEHKNRRALSPADGR